eukprot:6189644-Pleurochrysis_carterae.AAC.1
MAMKAFNGRIAPDVYGFYETPGKLATRSSVLQAYFDSPGNIMYLDDEHASCTKWFMMQSGCQAKHLHPVNRSASACKQIFEKTSVPALHGDFTNIDVPFLVDIA